MTKDGTTTCRRRHEILSLFTGAGALDYGFELTGRYETRLCVELEPLFYETLRDNQSRGFLSRADIIKGDAQLLPKKELGQKYFGKKGPTGIIAGPPCEAFSRLGKQGGTRDNRGTLIFCFMEWVLSLKPSFFVMENVPPLLVADNGRVFERLCRDAAAGGYSLSHGVLHAADFGAPTCRKRLFLVGMLDRPPMPMPTPSHSDSEELFGVKPHVTVREAFKGLPEAAEREPGRPQGHVLVRHTEDVINRFKSLKQGQFDSVRRRNRLHLDRIGPTLFAGNLAGIRSHIHPTEPRELTNRESARLHGFPDDFHFSGGHAAMGKQLANSVPIPLARAVGEVVAEHMDQHAAKATKERVNKLRTT